MAVGLDSIIEKSELKEGEYLINLGPQHPSTHGVFRMLLKMDGEFVVSATPVIGYLHRGIEKIAENRNYRQFMPYTDRLDYLSSMNNNLSYAIAVERLAGIKIPERAEYIRVIMAELNRISSHILYCGFFGIDLGAWTPLLFGFRERERIIDLFEMTCGARQTYNYMRIGGVSKDLPDEFIPALKEFIPYMKKKTTEMDNLLGKNPIFIARTKGIGKVSKELAIKYGASGHVLRSSGVKFDVRKDDTYSIYDRFEFEIPTTENGDSLDKYRIRIEEIGQSIRILEQAMKQIPDGDIMADVPYNLTVPKGEMYSRTENPRGELGFYIVSDGTDKPYRMKIRAPSFSNVHLVPEVAKGLLIADLVALLAAFDALPPETDR